MEDSGSVCLDHIGFTSRKKRSLTSRRPRPDSSSCFEFYDRLPFLPVSLSDDFNQCPTRVSSTSRDGEENLRKKIKRDNGRSSLVSVTKQGRNGLNRKQYSEGVHAHADRISTSKVADRTESQSGITTSHSVKNGEAQNLGHVGKVKLRLKVSGVNQTIHGDSTCSDMREDGSRRNSCASDATGPRKELILQGNTDDDKATPYKERGSLGMPKNDSSMRKNPGKSALQNQEHKYELAPKSKRVPKKRQIDDDGDDDEIRYLEKLKKLKHNGSFKDGDQEPNKKLKKPSCVSNGNMDNCKSSPEVFNGTPNDEEREPASDYEPKKEINMTKRQRALHLGKDTSSAHNANLEFPNGLPPAPSRKQKEKLSEVEQQLKKTEAAVKRKIQNEKAARECEAEAIRKILGQDSSRKKREDKIKKRQEELAQEKAANALVVPSNTVRWTMSPTGTIVTFANDMGLPSIFNSMPCCYPPPREKCAGPSCTNPYKYRDSKTKLPLCSLKCYKAVQVEMQDSA